MIPKYVSVGEVTNGNQFTKVAMNASPAVNTSNTKGLKSVYS